MTGRDHLPVGPVEEFLDHLRVGEGSSPNTVRSYAASLDRWWAYLAAAGLAWDEVTLPSFTPYLASLRTGQPPGVRVLPGANLPGGVAESTVAVRVAAVLSFYRYHGEVHGLPVAGRLHRAGRRAGRYLPALAHLRQGREQRPAVRIRRPEIRPMPVLTPGQIQAILDECARRDAAAGAWTGSVRNRLLFAALAGTGMRLGECLSTRHCDWHAGRGGTPFIEVLRRGQWLAPMRPETVYDLVAALKRRLGSRTPPGWTPHWFRHSHASALLLSGAREHVVMRRLGHADIQTTINLYGWVSEDAELRALAGWHRFCGAAEVPGE